MWNSIYKGVGAHHQRLQFPPSIWIEILFLSAMGKKYICGKEFYELNVSQHCNIVFKKKYVWSLNRDILGHTGEKQDPGI